MSTEVTYRNWASRLLLRMPYDWQFIIPVAPPPAWFVRSLELYEKMVLRVRTDDIAIDRPIFLIGLPRSGTTMLQDILCTHPQMAYFTNSMHQFSTSICAAETLRRQLRLDFRGERYLRDSVAVEAGSANEGHVFLLRWLQLDPYALSYPSLHREDISPKQISEIHETIRRVLWCFGGRDRRFFNKNPTMIFQVELLQEIFSDVRIIHIVRDPRECANSMLKLYRRTEEQLRRIPDAMERGGMFIPYPRYARLEEHIESYGVDDIHTTAHIWNDAITHIRALKSQLSYLYEVRYEDILADPAAEIEKIRTFCEISPVVDETTNYWQQINQVGVLHHTNNYGDYEMVTEICEENMLSYGYHP